MGGVGEGAGRLGWAEAAQVRELRAIELARLGAKPRNLLTWDAVGAEKGGGETGDVARGPIPSHGSAGIRVLGDRLGGERAGGHVRRCDSLEKNRVQGAEGVLTPF